MTMQHEIGDMEALTVGIRILSALLGVPVLIYVLIAGSKVLTVITTLVSIIALWEFYSVFKGGDIIPFQKIGILSGTIINLAAGAYGQVSLDYAIAVIITCTMVCFIVMVIQHRARIPDLGVTLIGLIYVSLFMSTLLLIYSMAQGPIIVWLVFIIAWLGDTCAYFIGINFGRHKLCPEISPHKSVEGSIGGLLGSVLGAVVFGFIVQRFYKLDIGTPRLIYIGLIGGTAAQLGDLAASLIKRYAKVKDFGNIIPGHGGVLDRFDSILFTAPVVYYIIKAFISG